MLRHWFRRTSKLWNFRQTWNEVGGINTSIVGNQRHFDPVGVFTPVKEAIDKTMDDNFVSRVPWSLEPSLKEKTDDLGIDFDRFIDGLKNNKTDTEIAEEFQVSQEAVAALREHFVHLGIQSVVGRD